MKKLVSAIVLAGAVTPTGAQFAENLPPECRQDKRPVALLDCLRNQQDVLQAVADYHGLLARIEKAKAERAANYLLGASTLEPDNTLARVQWFEENLQIYAVTGQPGSLTAHARLDGREFKLRQGDAIRQAQVSKIHSRGVEFQISGRKISIGLSGRVKSLSSNRNEN